MAYQIDTATDHKDFLSRIKTFSEANWWTTLRWDTSILDGESNPIYEWIAKAPGLAGVPVFSGTGTGEVTNYFYYPGATEEIWEIAYLFGGPGAELFSVTGSVSGYVGDADTGVPYDNGKISFTLTTGGTPYASGDKFTILITKPVYVGIQTYQSVASGYYNLRIAAFTSYDPLKTFSEQPRILDMLGIPLTNASMNYWLMVNAQRIMFAAKVGTNNESGYVGRILPYSQPSKYPYPVFVGGMLETDLALPYTDVSDSHTFCFRGGHAYSPQDGFNENVKYGSGRLTGASGEWRLYEPKDIGVVAVWPWYLDYTYDLDDSSVPFDSVPDIFELKPITGVYPLLHAVLQNILVYAVGPGNSVLTDLAQDTYGIFDGVRFIGGDGVVASEDTVIDGGSTFIVIKDAHRTGRMDFVALELA